MSSDWRRARLDLRGRVPRSIAVSGVEPVAAAPMATVNVPSVRPAIVLPAASPTDPSRSAGVYVPLSTASHAPPGGLTTYVTTRLIPDPLTETTAASAAKPFGPVTRTEL